MLAIVAMAFYDIIDRSSIIGIDFVVEESVASPLLILFLQRFYSWFILFLISIINGIACLLVPVYFS